MTSSDIKAGLPPTNGWRFKLGIGIFVAAFALLPVVPIAASLGTPVKTMAALTGVILVANKVLLITCAAVMGKPGFQRLKATVTGHATRLAPTRTAGAVRHVIGLVRSVGSRGRQRAKQRDDSDSSAA
ncbi:transporter suffix domain-containing protein [Paraburkholderia fungorum]|uniref:transporter suffix domain-containing protein n=1 Tax=Paraburkholderia fungorum TaxID=134537 RepID=UPI0038B87290